MLSLLCILFLSIVSSQNIPDQEYGYIDVRKGAHMFYWFYGSNNKAAARNTLPIVLWLQGGPGSGGSGYGNYGEMGPIDTYFNPRQYAWSNKVNLIFIDNPVGAGYSYVDNTNLLTTNVSQISSDLLECHKQLIAKYNFMTTLPYYIFTESYGGKMGANFGVALYNAIQAGDIKMNFKGVVLGDSWISGIAYVNTWADYLRSFTLINDNQYQALMNTSNKCQAAIDGGHWALSTQIWGQMEGQVSQYTNNVDFYYVLQFDNVHQVPLYDGTPDSAQKIFKYWHLEHIENYLSSKSNIVGGGVNGSRINYIMNNQVKQQLGIIPSSVTWGGQSGAVFSAQNVDFNKPVINDVNTLLSVGVKVVIENGQLDLICDTVGTLEWLQTINWQYFKNYHTAKKIAVKDPTQATYAYFKQEYENLAMYYIMNAGHMVPADNPIGAQMMLCDIVGVPF